MCALRMLTYEIGGLAPLSTHTLARSLKVVDFKLGLGRGDHLLPICQ